MVFWIDVDDAEIEFVADASDLVHVFHWLAGEFADVSEAVNVWIELHEEAEWVDLEDASFDGLADLVFRRNGLPRIVDELFHREEDLASFDVDDLSTHAVADFERVTWVIDALPGDFADVDQSFEIFFEADERTKVCDGRNGTFHRVADLVLGEDGFLLGFPDGFFRNDDFLFAFVHVDDLDVKRCANECLEFFVDLGLFATSDAWVVVWRELRDWDEGRNAFHACDEAAFVRVHHFDADDGTLREELFDLVPGALASGSLEREFEFTEFVVWFDYGRFDFVSDAKIEVFVELWTANETDGKSVQITTNFVATDRDHAAFYDIANAWIMSIGFVVEQLRQRREDFFCGCSHRRET